MEDSRTSNSSQRLSSTFDTLIESPEADITGITAFRPKPFPTGNNRDIPVSVQELVYGSKETGVGTSAKSLDRNNEILSSFQEAHGPRDNRGSSERLDTHVLQRTGPTDKGLAENPKYFVRGPKEEVDPRKGKQPSRSSSSLNKFQKRTSKPQRGIRMASKRQRERQSPSGTSLTQIITEFQREKRQLWEMRSVWQEL
ncbi:hypothetical protein O181_026268 [Austropuccinia psidii MF-1]|uniref:Uncharacterized protein n=1 Tax=Austropuccinia psidii MF-1 TaxID=1389203 RepID=A0A9Q3CPF9_9BASI|nr:hypothetical protein [Austropuccinia psidii MF-1]